MKAFQTGNQYPINYTVHIYVQDFIIIPSITLLLFFLDYTILKWKIKEKLLDFMQSADNSWKC